MARSRSQRRKDARSVASEDPWKVDTPFGPPRIAPFPVVGIRRLRSKLSRLSPAAFAEREQLKKNNRPKLPLTERNVDTFVSEQRFQDACHPDKHSPELEISAWLERLSPIS
ncbi:hypothetical protein ASPZODRAFT_128332 [Penicilliopsis zonata CBS 506.65]|uniref:Uncharacterized protein n=1 Tax=Penicilliopsis zonata CBS 506.65 TaxID=1073090 RepID=A0A1L9SRV9_9EURO|nr:hypothetical protein ASPZODRAFT_128332 [Penicilliopsis zonata CBS 506.65]OJJ49801.1 hypothetical protein ASPZODRAFT_128332 [Penicilliopsis zonata CBS 506.65]